jgi:hypothetical protein
VQQRQKTRVEDLAQLQKQWQTNSGEIQNRAAKNKDGGKEGQLVHAGFTSRHSFNPH